jgi:hypothetical protein
MEVAVHLYWLSQPNENNHYSSLEIILVTIRDFPRVLHLSKASLEQYRLKRPKCRTDQARGWSSRTNTCLSSGHLNPLTTQGLSQPRQNREVQNNSDKSKTSILSSQNLSKLVLRNPSQCLYVRTKRKWLKIYSNYSTKSTLGTSLIMRKAKFPQRACVWRTCILH